MADNGLSNLSMRKLAAALNASTNVIFYQFGSKENLIKAAMDRARSENLRLLESLTTENPALTVAEAFRAIWYWWMEEPSRLAYSRLNMEAMMTESGVDETARADLLEYWIDYFGRWLQRDGHREAEARSLATLMLSVQSGLTIDLLSTGDRARLDKAVEHFSKVLAI